MIIVFLKFSFFENGKYLFVSKLIYLKHNRPFLISYDRKQEDINSPVSYHI